MSSNSLFEIDANIINTISNIYQRTPESLNQDVIKLKLWMKTQPHLPEILEEKKISNFFILNKCSMERAKRSIDMYYTIRSQIPEMFENINPAQDNIKEIFEIIYWAPLPKMTEEMHRVLFFKMKNKELINKMEPHNVIAVVNILQELRLHEDVMFGDISVYDMEGISFGYLKKLTPSFLAKVFAIYEKVYSIPMKGMYVINSPPYVSAVLAIIKSVLKPKLVDRVFVCEDTSILHERFPKHMLPKDYGGEEKSLEELQSLLLERIQHHQKRFDLLDTLRVNEDLRPEKLKNDEILGFYGNFKKLNLD